MFSDHTKYSLRILLEMTHRDLEEYVPSKTLSELTDIPAPYARKIVGELVAHGYLQSKKGPKGGVRFRRDPSEILLRALMADLGELQHDSLNGAACCPTHDALSCFAEYFVERVRDEVVGEMTLDQLEDTLNHEGAA